LFILFAVLACTVTSFSQKVDLDKETIPVSYLRLPKDPLPDSYKFFSSIVSSRPNDLPSIGLSEASIQKYLVVPGYTRLQTGGDFNLELTIEDFKYEGTTDIQTEKKTSKDKNWKGDCYYNLQGRCKICTACYTEDSQQRGQNPA
jgi:hypothetical protein